jgi:hypothetical protein
VEKECGIKYCVFKKHTALPVFQLPNATFPSTVHLFFIFFGTGFEVLIVARIHIAVWCRTPYSVVRGYECLEEHFGSVSTGSQKLEAVCPD